MKRFTVSIAAAVAAFTIGQASANEFASALTSLAESEIKAWAQKPVVISAIKKQNREYTDLSQARIEEMDQQWRAQVGSGGPLIDNVLGNELSDYLKELRTSGGGLYTEIFVVDSKGLNVSQSDVTSDYWQGDEAKWKEPFNTGKLHIGPVELDESSQLYQSQVSLPIIDPDTGEIIGTMTVGVNVENLAQ